MIIYLVTTVPALLGAVAFRRWSTLQLAVVWIATCIALWALVPIGSRDYPLYLGLYDEVAAYGFAALEYQDPLYRITVWLLGNAGVGADVFILSLASFALLVKFTALSRLSSGDSLTVLLYMSSYFFVHEFTQVRAALAIGIWLHSLVLFQRSPRKAYLLTAFGCLIHLQAALGLVIYALYALINSPFRARIAQGFVIAIIALAPTMILDRVGFAVLGAIPDPRTAIYLAFAEEGTWTRPNALSLISLLALAIGTIGLKMDRGDQDRPDRDTRRLVFISLIAGSCALALLSAVAVAAFRVSEHMFVLIPVALRYLTRDTLSGRRYDYVMWLAWPAFAYLFVFHASYLLDPVTGLPHD